MSTADSEQLSGSGLDAQADDMALLRRYVDLGSQDAFNQLVGRHLAWVHATCRKGLRDRHMAEDAAQAVFIILARRAAQIPPQTRLSGWLFNTARFVIKDAKKQETRYRRRETVAREMSAVRLTPVRESVDAQTQAVLDDALATLTERDRLALLMHFYEGLSLQEMADVLGITKDGAKKRVARALSRLRTRMARNGKAAATVAVLAVLLRSRVAEAAPLGMAQTVASSATVPGVATSVAKWMAQRAMSTSAGASRRLLQALVALEVVAVATMVTVWSMPSRRVTVTSAVGASVVNEQPAPPQPPAKAKSPAPAARVIAAASEPATPYRSGAFDPEPRVEPLPPFADGPRPPAQSDGAGGGSGLVASSGAAVGTSGVISGGALARTASVATPLPLPPAVARSVPPAAPLTGASSSSSSSSPSRSTRSVAAADAAASASASSSSSSSSPQAPGPTPPKDVTAKHRPPHDTGESVATVKAPVSWPEERPKPVPAPVIHQAPPPPPPPFVAELPLPPPFTAELPRETVRPARAAGYGKRPDERGGRIVALALKDADDDDRGRRYGYGFGHHVGRIRREFFEEVAARVTRHGRKHESAAAVVAAVQAAEKAAQAFEEDRPICPPTKTDPAAALASDAALAEAFVTPYARVSGERRMTAYDAPAAMAADYAFAMPALSAQAVPEPTGFAVVALAGAHGFLSRRRRRSN